jgi:prepilin-type N-terminal cleavage/methylation domain-containing protein
MQTEFPRFWVGRDAAAARRAGRSCVIPTRRPGRRGGFSLIEVLGVVTILAILAVLLVPSVVQETDQATLNQEIANLNSFSNALVQSILQTQTIPTTTGMAGAMASNLPLPLIEITNNSRNFARSFLVDPNMLLNGLTKAALPYVQTTNGANPPPFNNARLLIVSTLGTANPPNPTGPVSPTTFSNLWSTPAYTKPTDPTWKAWNGNGRDVVIQRINLQPLFLQLILINHDVTGAAAFSIGTTNWTVVPTNFPWLNAYYFANTVVGLCNSNGVPMTRYVLTRNSSFVFENGAWNGQIINGQNSSISTNVAATFAIAATNFSVSAYNSPGADSGTGGGADQSTVLAAMGNFMLAYTLYANETPTPFAIPGSSTGMSQLLHGAAANVITYTGNGSGTNSGILSNP